MISIYYETFFYVLTFIIGAFFGSFLKLVADRSLTNESIIFPGSKCEFCKKHLKPSNLIPIISFVVQKARCSYCKKKLSYTYPLAEILTGISFLSLVLFFDIFNNLNPYNLSFLIYTLIIFCFYIIMTLTDLKSYIIPNKIVYSAIFVSFVFLTIFMIYDIFSIFVNINQSELGKYLLDAGYFKIKATQILISYGINIISSIIIALFFIFLIVITKGKGMGGGDVKLAFLIGLFNTFPYNIIAIFLGFIFGSVISIFLIVLKIKKIKDIIPFGPFLILGSLIALFYGPKIVDWYLNLI